MSPMAVSSQGSYLSALVPKCCIRQPMKQSSLESVPGAAFPQKSGSVLVLGFFRPLNSRIRSFQHEDAENYAIPDTNNISGGQDGVNDEILGKGDLQSDTGASFLAILSVAVGVAATITAISVGRQLTHGSALGFHLLSDGSTSSLMGAPPAGFTVKAFGYRIILPECTPGWVYFWLLMAAGCGLFISEEALNIWVGTSLARMLCLDGTRKSFVESLSRNAQYFSSTVLWVYWGVCISDMIPFYLGKLFRRSGASDDICSKLGIGKEKALSITRAVQRYGNLIGFVERFSLGVRNPTAFLAGALLVHPTRLTIALCNGISPDRFFAGVCCGGLITLSLQLGIGFLLRERPVFALATVATVVGIWTIFPYAIAASTALYLYLRRRYTT